jgi:hypothetical protein
MAAAESEPNEWAAKIDQLRAEMREMLKAHSTLRREGKLTKEQQLSISKAFNEVVRTAGIGLRPENNAVTYAVLRQAIHVERRMIAESHPELEEEFNRLSPPRKQRAIE